ncbi:primosomal protein N' [Alphaproteobacteria bacterium]|nr:primosomal protein N' [Alphaproteobacteria bacterium]
MSVFSEKNIKVLLPVPFEQAFTYTVPEGVQISKGDYVQVSFGSRILTGVVWEEAEEEPSLSTEGGVSVKASYTLKPLLKKFDLPQMKDQSRQFVEWVSHYYMMPLGLVLKMVMSEPSVFKDIKKRSKPEEKKTQKISAELSESQKTCTIFLRERLKEFHTVLLEGATGSGKTEVYLDIIKEMRVQGKQSLVLLPEIALSTQWLERFEQRFGEKPVLWHSEVTPAQRRESWKKVASGEASVVVGARSALFLPYKDLGFIVVDEEHDAGYKQESGVFYQARDMAVVRGSLANCLVVLASATPSLETIVNVEKGRYEKCVLTQRYGGAVFPDISIIDRREPEGQSVAGSKWISEPLYKAIQETIAQKNQVLLFLNRRGYSSMLLCRACGVRTSCKQCDTWLVYHKHSHRLQCHHCGYSQKVPKACKECGEEGSFIPCGPGVERVMEEVQALFPEAKALMMTSDTMTTLKKSQEMVEAIQNKDVDIIVGTQVMAKGHHFPDLTLVGVVDGDLGLGGTDLRLMERTYQLLHQVAGRSGRAQKKGRVFIQSHMGDHPLMQGLTDQDPSGFLSLEKESRQLYAFPPYGRLAAVIVSGKQSHLVEQMAKKMGTLLPPHTNIEILGPVAASMAKLKGQYRWRFLIKGPRSIKLQPFIKRWIEGCQVPSFLKVQIDIDPYSFY